MAFCGLGESSFRGCWCWSDAHVSMASSSGGSGEIGCSLGRKSEKGGQAARREAAPRGARPAIRHCRRGRKPGAGSSLDQPCRISRDGRDVAHHQATSVRRQSLLTPLGWPAYGIDTCHRLGPGSLGWGHPALDAAAIQRLPVAVLDSRSGRHGALGLGQAGFHRRWAVWPCTPRGFLGARVARVARCHAHRGVDLGAPRACGRGDRRRPTASPRQRGVEWGARPTDRWSGGGHRRRGSQPVARPRLDRRPWCGCCATPSCAGAVRSASPTLSSPSRSSSPGASRTTSPACSRCCSQSVPVRFFDGCATADPALDERCSSPRSR